MQSHKNQVHRLVLIDRVLQHNTFHEPAGMNSKDLEQCVQSLLSTSEGQQLTSVPFNELWKGKDAFRKDLKFILTHYPEVMQKVGNKLWSYSNRGASIFPRFGNIEKDARIHSLILLLDYIKELPFIHDFDIEQSITTLKNWYGWSTPSNAKPLRNFHHQFSSEDSDAFSKNHIITLHESLGINIVEIKYTSSRQNLTRHLEFHPWEFHQSEGRWYVAGFISADLEGNYPGAERSNYPGLVLKLSQIQSVIQLKGSEIQLRQSQNLNQQRHTFITRDKYPTLLDFQNRIGVGGWDHSLIALKGRVDLTIEFRITEKAYKYFESTTLVSYCRKSNATELNGWIKLLIPILPTNKVKGTPTISTLNRELIDILRSYGAQIEILSPTELRDKFRQETRQAASFYKQEH